MKPPIIKCSCCNGSGKVPLSAPLLETLAVVPSDIFMSTQDIVTRLKIEYVKPTAINNRLRLGLLPLKLVECERRGKAMFWKRVK